MSSVFQNMYTLNLCTLFLNHTWGLFSLVWLSHFILTTLRPPHLFMCRTDHSCCHSQARGELRDSWRCVHPQKCPLHALPGLQWKARHAACERGQLWKGKALQKCLENTWKLKRSVAGVLYKINDVLLSIYLKKEIRCSGFLICIYLCTVSLK